MTDHSGQLPTEPPWYRTLFDGFYYKPRQQFLVHPPF